MKWWLISDEDVRAIHAALQAATHKAIYHNCKSVRLGQFRPECPGCEGDKLRKQAMRRLETGLRVTDVIPKDFEEADESQS